MSVFEDIKTGLGQAIEQERVNKIAKDFCSKYAICTCNERDGHCSAPQQHARIMYELGYRKQDEVAEEVLEKVKEMLEPTVSALFIISEILVDESKSHISSQKALNDIRERLGGTISSRYRLEKVLEEIKEDYEEKE